MDNHNGHTERGSDGDNMDTSIRETDSELIAGLFDEAIAAENNEGVTTIDDADAPAAPHAANNGEGTLAEENNVGPESAHASQPTPEVRSQASTSAHQVGPDYMEHDPAANGVVTTVSSIPGDSSATTTADVMRWTVMSTHTSGTSSVYPTLYSCKCVRCVCLVVCSRARQHAGDSRLPSRDHRKRSVVAAGYSSYRGMGSDQIWRRFRRIVHRACVRVAVSVCLHVCCPCVCLSSRMQTCASRADDEHSETRTSVEVNAVGIMVSCQRHVCTMTSGIVANQACRN